MFVKMNWGAISSGLTAFQGYNENNPMRIYKKLTLVALFLITLPMAIMAFLFFYNAETYIKKEILVKLNAIADLKVDKLNTYLGERQDDFKVLQSLHSIKASMPSLIRYRSDRNNPDYLEARKALDKQLILFSSSYSNYSNILLFDANGTLVYLTDPRSYFSGSLDKPLLINGHNVFEKSKTRPVLSDIYAHPDNKSYALLISGPLYDTDGRFIGVAAIEIDMSGIYQFIQNTTGLGVTGETLLLEKRGLDRIVYLNILRHDNAPPLSKVIRLGDRTGTPAQAAANGKNGFGIELDYRGEKVLAAWRYMPALGWGLVAKIDAKESFAPIHQLQKTMLFIFTLSFILTITIIVWAVRSITDPIRKLHEGARIVGDGNLDYRFDLKGNDEITDLAGSFNKMTSELNRSMTSIENYRREIEARKKAERDLEKALNVKSEFTSMVSHELRTPLSAIKEGVSLILDGVTGAINQDQKEVLGTIKNNTERLHRLINNILDFQKLGSGKMEFDIVDNDINEAVSEACETMKLPIRQKGLELSLELDKDLPKIRFGKDSIIQVLINLLNNASKFTEKGRIRIRTRRDNGSIRVTVSDTGRGIKQEDMQKLFQSFERIRVPGEKRVEGSGLGLAICRAIIEHHKGKIWAESETGKGSAFHFTLPV